MSWINVVYKRMVDAMYSNMREAGRRIACVESVVNGQWLAPEVMTCHGYPLRVKRVHERDKTYIKAGVISRMRKWSDLGTSLHDREGEWSKPQAHRRVRLGLG